MLLKSCCAVSQGRSPQGFSNNPQKYTVEPVDKTEKLGFSVEKYWIYHCIRFLLMVIYLSQRFPDDPFKRLREARHSSLKIKQNIGKKPK